jgi:hypothetical protein
MCMDVNVCTCALGAYTLRIGLGHYMMGGFLPGLKGVSCCPSDHPHEGNMGAQ